MVAMAISFTLSKKVDRETVMCQNMDMSVGMLIVVCYLKKKLCTC